MIKKNCLVLTLLGLLKVFVITEINKVNSLLIFLQWSHFPH